MAKTIERFDFHLLGAKGSSLSPAVVIVLQAWDEHEKCPCVSAYLMTEGEIDQRIADLKADLDVVGRRAKIALAAAH